MKTKDRKKERRKVGSGILFLYLAIRLIVAGAFIYFLLERQYFLALECVLVLLLMFIPSIIERRLNIELPSLIEIIAILFIFAAVFLGEINDFYSVFPMWDTMLHTTCGFVSAAVGISLIDILNKSDKVSFYLSPFFVVVFGFCFSMTVGVIWEFYEFFADKYFILDMQKDTYINTITSLLFEDGRRVAVESVIINGQGIPGYIDIGLIDTIYDLLANAIGAFVMSVGGWFYLKRHGAKWVQKLLLKTKSAIGFDDANMM